MAQFRFTSRSGGISIGAFASLNLAAHVGDDIDAVRANRKILSAEIGLPEERIHYMNQVHGADVAIIDPKIENPEAPRVDALFTQAHGHALVTLIADCVPVLLHSRTAVAAVHVGRQGLVVGALEAAIEVFVNHGIEPGEISAEIGPSICGSCYEVDLEMYRDVTSKRPATATDENSHRLDIAAGVVDVLEKSGMRFNRNFDCTICTDGYFSYRRDGATGRQAGVIWL